MPKYRYRIAPYAHQHRALVECIRHPAFALFMEMGTGKTKVMCDRVAFGYQVRGDVRRALIVCPRSCFHVWRDEFRKHVGYGVTVLDQPAVPARVRQLELGARREQRGQPFIAVTNFEALRLIGSALKAISWDVMILDESARVKNHRAQRTRWAIAIGSGVRYRYILSGLPTTSSPLDIYSQFEFLDKGILGYSNFYSFRRRHATMDQRFPGRVLQYHDLDVIKVSMAPHVFDIRKVECLDLPSKVYEHRTVMLTAEQRRAYDALVKEMLVELSGVQLRAPHVLTRLMRLTQLTGGFLPLDDEHRRWHTFRPNPKMEALVEVLEDLGDAKVVVWAHFRKEIEEIQRRCVEKLGMPQTPKVYGGMTAADVEHAIRIFQDGDARVLVGQPQSGGMGITLTAAHNTVYYSNGFSLEGRVQSEDRVHRIGQMHSCLYVDLVAENSYDAAVLRALRGHRELADYMTRLEHIRAAMEGRLSDDSERH